MVLDLMVDLKELSKISSMLELEENKKSIENVIERLSNDNFDVAIVGEFKRGKSSLINALIEKDVLPTNPLPATATLNRVTYSPTPFVKIMYHDGTSEEIGIEQLEDYVTKLTDEAEEKAQTIREATVYYPTNYCRNNIDIIDTPGLNDDANMTAVTMELLPNIDAAIFVMMAHSPFSAYEKDFLENKLMTSDLGKIMFVVTRIDDFNPEDAKKVLEGIRKRIEIYVVKKAKKIYGADSEEFQKYQKRLGEIKIFGVSSKEAMKAKKTGNQELLEKSGFPIFEQELERFLTEERGLVTLQMQINKILSATTEILNAVDMRINALNMQKEEFQQNFERSMEEIETIRCQKESELETIRTSSKQVFIDLQPMIYEFWDLLKARASEIIDEEEIALLDLEKDTIEATQQRIQEKISMASDNLIQLQGEKIQAYISQSLGKEAQRLQDFNDKFMIGVEQIQLNFTTKTYQSAKTEVWKGAVKGGSTALSGAIGISSLAFMLHIPISLPVVLIVASIGTLTGKIALDTFLLGDKVSKFKENAKKVVLKQLKEAEVKSEFAQQVRGQVEDAFGALETTIDQEVESVLLDTQKTLVNLQIQIAQKELTVENMREKYSDMIKGIHPIIERATRLDQQMSRL